MQAVKEKGPDDESISSDTNMYLVEKVGLRFYGYCLNVLGNVSKKSACETFNLTLLAHYFGMSRQGIDLFSKLGYMTRLRTFDKYKKEVTNLAALRYKYVYI